MASRLRSLSKPAHSLFKSATAKSVPNVRPTPSLTSIRSSLSVSRSFPQLGCVQSLLPLHSAISSARLTSCLAIDSSSSRSLSQGMLNAPGV
ncbi:protein NONRESPONDING TO OXYLIPINS 2, mitochondrial isoform X1 [Humulus lupulus]|uniref:protein NONRESPONDING TO OXYLIPINS 2, mitochondrial isoform X1 n=1 Tax=Humulus lupulus TaxID=3486 RepID=UPI002B40B61E|nr:protein NONRESPONDING TO OXYLIPINS 2, mitochondrial isoform X1 [Humulus lupulus]